VPSHQHFLFGMGLYFLLFCEVQSHVGKQQASHILLAVSGKEVFFFEEGTHFFTSYISACADLELMLCVM
jgi:hypothetical protein